MHCRECSRGTFQGISWQSPAPQFTAFLDSLVFLLGSLHGRLANICGGGVPIVHTEKFNMKQEGDNRVVPESWKKHLALGMRWSHGFTHGVTEAKLKVEE